MLTSKKDKLYFSLKYFYSEICVDFILKNWILILPLLDDGHRDNRDVAIIKDP